MPVARSSRPRQPERHTMNILGLNVFHADAAACLLQDGKVVGAVAEERLGKRRKHFAGFPATAIRSVLERGGIGIGDVDYVAVGHDARTNFGAKAAYAVRRPIRAARSVIVALQRSRQVQSLADQISEHCGVPRAECHFETVLVEHHLAHLASSFYASPFEEAAGFSYDASGDFVSAMFAHCKGTDITVLARVMLPHSLGYFYTAVCQFIGFDHFAEEYKVMGLAAYGEPRHMDLMRRMLTPVADGQYRMGSKYFSGLLSQPHQELVNAQGELVIPPLYSAALADELGAPRRRGAELTDRDRDLAASCQRHFEDVVMHCARHLHDRVPVDALVTAGGCALNGVANARILRDTPFRRSYIHCAAGDDGTAVGAALHVWNSVLKRPRVEPVMHPYWGPDHDLARMEQALRAAGLTYRHTNGTLIETAADYLADGQVLGWYQGRSEWGPRALGNRSILAHPGWPGMKDLINLKIKRREAFRPFAPSILAERVADYFEQDVQSPFMMHVVRIRAERRAELMAVTHEDGTGRLHTVTREANPQYYDLISAFAQRTGTPVVLNTSFNENEPIVDTPEQAVDCFVRNDMDVLCLGPFVSVKQRAD
jgi:carbamoyltransferase